MNSTKSMNPSRMNGSSLSSSKQRRPRQLRNDCCVVLCRSTTSNDDEKKKKASMIREVDFSGQVMNEYVVDDRDDDDGKKRKKRFKKRKGGNGVFDGNELKQKLRQIFLPAGFPKTVSNDYLSWLKWQMLSLFFRDVLEVLSAQSLLVAIGLDVTEANAVAPIAGAAKWVIKDGTGGVATLLLGAVKTKKIDENPKFFWSATNSLEDVSRAMELITPLFPSHFLLIAGTATFVRSAALTGRSSLVNGTFMTHFARNENAGDIRTKLEVQGRWLQIAALPVGIGIFRAVTNSLDFVASSSSSSSMTMTGGGDDIMKGISLGIITYGSMLLSHSLCCYMAAKSLKFETLSRRRLLIQAKHFVFENNNNNNNNNNNRVLTVDEVSEIEGVWRSKEEDYLNSMQFGVTPSDFDFTDFEDDVTTTNFFIRRSDRDLIEGNDDYIIYSLLTRKAKVRDLFCCALAMTKLKALLLLNEDDDVKKKEKALQYANENVELFTNELSKNGFRVDVCQTGDMPSFEFNL
jgi:hypothetical protein